MVWSSEMTHRFSYLAVRVLKPPCVRRETRFEVVSEQLDTLDPYRWEPNPNG